LVTNPPFLPLILGNIAYKRNIPFFVVVYDLYPNALRQVKLIREGSLLYKYWVEQNKKIFARAAGIITLSAKMKSAVEEYLPENKASTVSVIPNWFEEKEETKNSTFFDEPSWTHTFSDKWLVIYAGNFGLTHDLESLVKAASLLRDHTNIQFILAGEGAQKKRLMTLSEQLGMKNIEFLPYQTTKQYFTLLRMASIGVVSLGVGAEAISVPSKTYTVMASGLCLLGISPHDSGLAEIINQYDIGKNSVPNHPENLAKILTYLYEHPDELDLYRKNAKTASLNFTAKNVELYNKLIHEKIKEGGY
jgi:glycosyltransferase involved in cell wall biosynthesis